MRLPCAWFRRQWERYLDLRGALPRGLAAHLDACAACRAEWDVMRRLAADLTEVTSLPKPSDHLLLTVLSALPDAQPGTRPGRSHRSSALGSPLLLAGTGGLLLAGVLGAALVLGLFSTQERPDRQFPRPLHAERDPGRRDSPLSPADGQTREHAGGDPTSRPLQGQQGPGGRGLGQEPLIAPAPGRHGAHPEVPKTPPATDDFLDGRDPRLIARWSPAPPDEQDRVEAILRGLPPAADDFVRIPFPRLVASAPGAAVAAAVRDYEQQARVVDTRLFRKVTLRVKGASLADVCAQLKEQTGVELRASRTMADEKVTVLVKGEEARSVMRAIARLFGVLWARSGEEGAYRYELVQDLKSQLVEEELRNRDVNAALLALDAEMQTLRPYAEMPFDQAYRSWEKSGRQVKGLFGIVVQGGWGGLQMYHRLTAAERAALVSGQELVLRPNGPNPDARLPGEWVRPIIQSRPVSVRHQGASVKVMDIPGMRVAQLRLRLKRSELGQLTLSARTTLAWDEAGLESNTFWDQDLATARNPSAEKPGNAELNAGLRGKAPFDRPLVLRPQPSCPAFRQAAKPRPSDQETPAHVTSADVWEAVHEGTGLPIVADFYTRLYPQRAVTLPETSLLDALCQAGDTLGVRWTRDGSFILARSTGYFWDKLKEVPGRYLERWQRTREANRGLPLADLLEIALLRDQQLDSMVLAEAVEHCWGIPEWRLISGHPGNDPLFRTLARYLTILTPEQLRKALEPDGVPFRSLSPAQQQATLMRHEETMQEAERQWGKRSMNIRPEDFLNAQIVAEYVPAGWFVWNAPLHVLQQPRPQPLTRVAAPTAAEALAAARLIDPGATPEQVVLSKSGRLGGGIRFVFRAPAP